MFIEVHQIDPMTKKVIRKLVNLRYVTEIVATSLNTTFLYDQNYESIEVIEDYERIAEIIYES